MKSSRIRKVHKELSKALTNEGIELKNDSIYKITKINNISYQLEINHTPKSTNVSKELQLISSKLLSKEQELTKIVDHCVSNYQNLRTEEIIPILQGVDSYNKKIKRIHKELIEQIEKTSIDNELSDFENVIDYPDIFPLARKRKRKIVAHLGETNSGKTFHALSELANNSNTAYLAPLRLLALENYDYLNDRGIPTSLITGEERRYVENNQCVSSTVECFNFNNDYDLIIIDEIQMIDDPDRGWAFIQALVGANAGTIIVTGPREYDNRIRQIAEYLNDEVEIKYFDRKSKLKVDTHPTHINNIKKNTALVTFSRRDIFKLKKQLPKNLKASLIYGALGSDVRKLQAERYINGETDVLITTDAIGMGLNLPIERILFTTHEKYNGKTNTVLGDMLTKQISGRAGRYGIFDVGYVGATNKDSLNYVKDAMKSSLYIENNKFKVQPTDDYINKLMAKYNLSTILSDWSENTRFPESSMFVHDDMDNKIMIAKYLEKAYPEKVKEYYRLINCPIDVDKDMPVFKIYVKQMLEDRDLQCPMCVPSALSVSDLEQRVKEMLIFMWFLNQYPDVAIDYDSEMERARQMLNNINTVLNEKLSK